MIFDYQFDVIRLLCLKIYGKLHLCMVCVYRGSQEGSNLVICCEGNAGFYEMGIMATPLTAGYSVLGWNMPGFAFSTVSHNSDLVWLSYYFLQSFEFIKY